MLTFKTKSILFGLLHIHIPQSGCHNPIYKHKSNFPGVFLFVSQQVKNSMQSQKYTYEWDVISVADASFSGLTHT